MARTPLLHALLRGLAREMPASQPTRRDVLKLGVAATLAACGPKAAQVQPTPPKSGPAIVIVGGGLAGLHCAYRLWRDHGLRSRVLEAQERLGGRIFTDHMTFRDLEGMHAELGGELIDSGHATMLGLAKELGIELLDYTQDDATLAELTAHFGGQTLGTAALLQGWQPVAGRIAQDQLRITDPELYPTYKAPAGGEQLDRTSLQAYLGGIL